MATLLRLALWTHPTRGRTRYGDEVVNAARDRYEELRGEGKTRAWSFALRAFWDVARAGVGERWTERRSDGGGEGMMGRGGWWMDLRVAARTLRKSPGFTLTSVVVLALGIGANTAIFSAIRATLLSPPPYPHADRIVFLDLTDSSTVRPATPRGFPWSYPKYHVLEEARGLPLEASAAYARRFVTLTGQGTATYLTAEFITPAYLDVLGLEPALGRDFGPEDDTDGAPLEVMLEHGLWRERFGADPSVVGRTVQLNGRAVTIVGVGPRGFRGLTGDARMWVPVHTGATLTAPFLTRGAQAHWLRVVARARPGTDVGALDRRMRAVGRAVEEAYPGNDPTVVSSASAESMVSARVNDQARRSLLILGAAAVLLLLVACANLAGLLAARASHRSREAAVRVALGAGRWRVARGFLAEALVLALLGGALAVGVAALGVEGLSALWPQRFVEASWNVRAASVGGVGVDRSVLAFAGGMAVLVGLLFGAAPALSVGQTDPGRALKGGAVPARPGRRRLSLRSTLVVGEIAMALVLLVGAGLLIRSLRELQHVDRGFRPGNLVAFGFSIPRTSPLAENRAAFTEEYLARLSGLPGVKSAALTCVLPMAGHCMIAGMRRAGARTWDAQAGPPIGIHYVSDGFFRTLGVPVLQGRTFTSEDQAGSRPVVVLSESAAKRYFPDGDALGSPVAMTTELTSEEGATAEVIGIVGDVLYDRPEQGIMPEAYISHRQESESGTVVLRTDGEPLAVIPAARAVLARMAPDVPIYDIRTADDVEAAASADTRVLGVLLSVFAALALVLACTGVWAVVAFAVARRTRELGLRVALGADPAEVVRLVVRSGVGLAAVGLILGSGAAWMSSRLLASVLFGVEPTDPVAFVSAGAVLFTVAVLAAWLPARRATRVDPMEALRSE
ncbi:MAG: ABC transporter permease [Gemmatimonadota bacterium]